MEPVELNAGRFYLRQLSGNDRIDDVPALSVVRRHLGHASVDPNIIHLRQVQWQTGSCFSWAVCEQTRVELLAEALLIPEDGVLLDPTDDHGEHDHTTRATRATIEVRPAGDPARILPNDPVLEPKTVADAVAEASAVISRWAQDYLGLSVRVL